MVIRRITRKPLEDWQQSDAARLRDLWSTRPFQSGRRISQANFADQFDLGSQSVVHQYLSGLIPLNLEATVKFAQGLGCTVRQISPVLDQRQEKLPDPFQDSALLELISIYGSLAQKEKDALLRIAQELKSRIELPAKRKSPRSARRSQTPRA